MWRWKCTMISTYSAIVSAADSLTAIWDAAAPCLGDVDALEDDLAEARTGRQNQFARCFGRLDQVAFVDEVIVLAQTRCERK